MKVCKFGGTSLATAKTLALVKDIILSDPARKFVVVSAPGKRFKDDDKVTDLLYRAFDEKVMTGTCKTTMKLIKQRYIEIRDELKIDFDIEKYLNEVEKGINKSETADFAASRGEYLSGLLIASYLGYKFVDAAEIIKFKVDGSYDSEITEDLVYKTLKNTDGVVIPGFYGRKPNGNIKTFTRGGSDFTGAIIAGAMKVDIYENWTDVNGVAITDPRIVKNPCFIDVISYEELRELSYMGASVLHPDSVFPVQSANIPINIKNTFEPDNPGTLIKNKIARDDMQEYPVTGIAGRKSNTTINIKKAMMNNELGFARRVLSVLERCGISIEHIPTGIDTMSIVLSEKGFEIVPEHKVIEGIKIAVNPDCIEVVHNLSLIAIVGHGMASRKGTAARVFTALAKADVNVRMIDQGSSEINIIVGVEDKDFEKSIRAIYDEFFGE
jgi:aspartate kinase